jgi:hypothetical protein
MAAGKEKGRCRETAALSENKHRMNTGKNSRRASFSRDWWETSWERGDLEN